MTADRIAADARALEERALRAERRLAELERSIPFTDRQAETIAREVQLILSGRKALSHDVYRSREVRIAVPAASSYVWYLSPDSGGPPPGPAYREVRVSW